jgi:hypothetical protein
MQAFSEELEEFDLLGTLEVERLQLGSIAKGEWHQIGGRVRQNWIHFKAEAMNERDGRDVERCGEMMRETLFEWGNGRKKKWEECGGSLL